MNELAIIQTIANVLNANNGANGTATDVPSDLAHDTHYDPVTRRIATCDMLVEGTHFDLAYFTPQDLGWKAAAVNISDIAATGGQLESLLVSMGLPKTHTTPEFIHELYTGLNNAAQTYQGKIIGGDSVYAKQLTLSVTALGRLPEGHTPGRRNQAKPGDVIISTGFHGLSAAGLCLLKQHSARKLKKPFSGQVDRLFSIAHLHPTPRITEGQYLSKRFQRYAMMDTSDGLADGLLKIAHASNVRLLVDRAKLPVHAELQAYAELQHIDVYHWILYGGEDFELLATVPATAILEQGLPKDFCIIGHVEATTPQKPPGAFFIKHPDDPLVSLAYDQTYQHF